MSINVQTGSAPGDANYTSDAQIRERLAAIRRARGLAPDYASDSVWLRRIKAGTHTLGDARTAITRKGVEQEVARQRSSLGLNPDPVSDQIWVDRVTSGRADLNEVSSRLQGKATDQGATPPPDPNAPQDLWEGVEDPGPVLSTESATAIIQGMLREYGLEYDRQTIGNWVGMLSDSGQQIMPVIEEEIRQSGEFKQRFPGLQARLDAGLNAISIDEYLQLEDAYTSLMRASGLPRGFYDSPEDFAEFIAKDVSPAEMETRIQRGVVAAQQAPDEVKDALENFYGISNSLPMLAAYMLDPDRALPVIERQFQAAQVGGAGQAAGFGVGRDQAERLASLGVQTLGQAQQGFAQANRTRALGAETISERTDITDRDLVDAGFGVSAEADRMLRDRLARRRAQFAGSTGGAGGSQQGSFLGSQR